MSTKFISVCNEKLINSLKALQKTKQYLKWARLSLFKTDHGLNLNFKVYQYNYYIHVKLLRIKYPTDAIFHNVISIHNLHSQFKDILDIV